jgi:hypothetical protein
MQRKIAAGFAQNETCGLLKSGSDIPGREHPLQIYIVSSSLVFEDQNAISASYNPSTDPLVSPPAEVDFYLLVVSSVKSTESKNF